MAEEAISVTIEEGSPARPLSRDALAPTRGREREGMRQAAILRLLGQSRSSDESANLASSSFTREMESEKR